MKKIIYCIAAATFTLSASCSETTKKDNATNDSDTAVLKEDPNNTMNAAPVNDTNINTPDTPMRQ